MSCQPILPPGTSVGAAALLMTGLMCPIADPFQLTVDGDKLFGRGTTDCLGHVALMTMFFEQLAIQRPTTQRSIVCVLIASEEAESVPVAECGVEVLHSTARSELPVECVVLQHLLKEGRLEQCKAGPVFWIDSADSQPCVYLHSGSLLSWCCRHGHGWCN